MSEHPITNYSYLSSIIEGDLSFVKDYYQTHSADIIDVLLAYKSFALHHDDTTYSIAALLWHNYKNQDLTDEQQKRFNTLTWSYVGANTDFLLSLSDEPSVQLFLSEYHSHIKEQLHDLKMKYSKIIYQGDEIKYRINLLPYLTELLDTNIPANEQKRLSDTTSLFDYNYRLSDLSQASLLQETLEKELVLIAFSSTIKGKYLLDDVDNLIHQGKKIVKLFSTSSEPVTSLQHGQTIYQPLVNTLAHDIVYALIHHPDIHSSSIHLWDNIEYYNVKDIHDAKLTSISLPQTLRSFYPKIDVVQSAIWVMLPNGEIRFGQDTISQLNTKDMVHHIDIANGENVLSAGIILFSGEDKKVLAINNRSGHYFPSLDSLKENFHYFTKTPLNTSDVIIADYQWSNLSVINSNQIGDVENKIMSIRHNQQKEKTISSFSPLK